MYFYFKPDIFCRNDSPLLTVRKKNQPFENILHLSSADGLSKKRNAQCLKKWPKQQQIWTN